MGTELPPSNGIVLNTDGKDSTEDPGEQGILCKCDGKGGFVKTNFSQGSSEQELLFRSSVPASGRACLIQTLQKLVLFSQSELCETPLVPLTEDPSSLILYVQKQAAGEMETKPLVRPRAQGQARISWQKSNPDS